jgi:hypothetical protein
MLPSSFWKQTTAHQQSRSSQAASAQQLSPRSTVTILPDPHRHLLDPVSPVDPTAILPAPQAPSAITALQAQAPVAVHVSVTVSLAEATESSSTVEDPAVATVTIPAHAVHPIPRPNTLPGVPAATDWSSDDDRFEFFETRRETFGRSFVMAISSLHNTNPKRQAGPDAPHEGRIRGPVVTNSCDCAISLFTTILHAHFSVLKLPSIERKGMGVEISLQRAGEFF